MTRVWPEPDRRGEESARPDFGPAQRPRRGARPDPHDPRTRLPIHRGDPHNRGRAALRGGCRDDRARSAPPPATNLPEPVSELIGRDAEFDEILDLIAAHRLVTLTGAGGIGKTRLGLEVARRLLPKFADGVWVIELAPLSDPDLVPVTVATALGLDLADDVVSPERVANALASKQLLLVLDNCEHLVGAAASMAEALLRANPAARVLATSREPLRAEGECLYPGAAARRADGGQPGRGGSAAIRRRAAVRCAGARGGAALLGGRARCRGDRGDLPASRRHPAGDRAGGSADECARGRRARVPPRRSLPAADRRIAARRCRGTRRCGRRLTGAMSCSRSASVSSCGGSRSLPASFTLEAASTIAAIDELADSDVVDCAANLVAKSLVAADLGGATGWYRLLETTRAYALEKLTQSGEFEQVARRHAEYYRDLFERAEAELETRPASEWLAAYGRRIDDLRAALDWAFSPTGDMPVGVALTIAAVPLWIQLSLVQECRGRVERALASLVPEAGRSASQEMKLYAALGASLLYSKGPMPETEVVWAKALELAESLGDTQYQLRALYGLWACRLNCGEYGVTLTLARRFYSLTQDRGDPADLPIGDQMIGVSLHYCGDQTNARRHIERMLGGYVAPVQRRVGFVSI